MYQLGQVPAGPAAGPDPPIQRVQSKISVEACRELPADDASGEHVDDERRINPSGERSDRGDVGNPKAVRGGRSEPVLDEVRGPVRQRTRERCPGSFGPTGTAKAL